MRTYLFHIILILYVTHNFIGLFFKSNSVTSDPAAAGRKILMTSRHTITRAF